MKTIVRRQSESEVVAISLKARISDAWLIELKQDFYALVMDRNMIVMEMWLVDLSKTLPWLAIKNVPGNQIEVNTGEFVPKYIL